MNQDLAEQLTQLKKGKEPKVAIQGYDGSFHQIVARSYLGDNVETLPCDTFRQVVATMETGKADIGVMAIENSIAGSILPNYTILQNSKMKIVGEAYLMIRQHLMANTGVKVKDIEEVQSHPIALLQCTDYLDRKKWKLVESEDTALSARKIAESGTRTGAAIASSLAAKLFGLEIIARNIHTVKNNYTRFLVVAPLDANIKAHNADKASLYFKTDHRHGSLVDVLRTMDCTDINMTKLQSYPIPSEPFHYMFHVDMEFDNVEILIRTIDEMREKTVELNILGIYRKGPNL